MKRLLLLCTLSLLISAISLARLQADPPPEFSVDGVTFTSGLMLSWQNMSPDCQLIELPAQAGEARRVMWQNLYEQVDLTISTDASGEQITYEWVVYPGGNPAHIAIDWASAEQPVREIFSLPGAWQDQGGMTNQACEVQFAWQPSNMHLDLGAYEPAQVLTIHWQQKPHQSMYSKTAYRAAQD